MLAWLRAAKMAARRALAMGLLTVVVVAGTATQAQAATVSTNIKKVTCGSSTGWLRIWTQTHGYPVCYANAGTVTYGWSPPNTTWTTYGICTGNNVANIDFYYYGSAPQSWNYSVLHLGKNVCVDFTDPSWFGRSEEVARITIL
jgi:hypothetical protein